MPDTSKALHALALAAATAYIAFVGCEVVWPWLRRRLRTVLPGTALAQRLRLPPGRERVLLTAHEEALAEAVLSPADIHTTLSDIGGNRDAIRRLASVVQALSQSDANGVSQGELSSYAQSPKGHGAFPKVPTGVLMHGPPGCGKTMLARAIAHDAGVRFLAVEPAMLADKWLGETEKNVSALFSLARKVSPALVFIDEIDGLTRHRGTDAACDSLSAVRTQLLAAWDGVAADAPGAIVVLGATNRPQDIDAAFMRRMPLRVAVRLPDCGERREILDVMLGAERRAGVDTAYVASLAEGLSGSDLREIIRRAADPFGGEELSCFSPVAMANDAPLTTESLAGALRSFVSERDDCLSPSFY